MENTKLTNREKELCSIMFKSTPWKTAPETAKELNLSERTIEVYLSNIYKKVSVNTKEQLYNYWTNNKEGYNYTENLIESIIKKLDDIYYVSTDKEFFFSAGIGYAYLKSLENNLKFASLYHNIFKDIDNIIRKEYTEKNIKQLLTHSLELIIDKIEYGNKIGQLIAGVLMYNLEGNIEDKESTFFAGIHMSDAICKKLLK